MLRPMLGFVGWLPWVLAPGCMGPYPFPLEEPGAATGPARCDGVLQQAEGGVIDGPFDRDEDGFVDALEPECASAYAPHLLDCDDQDPQVNPGAREAPCNARDDDCAPQTPDEIDADEDGYTCDDCDDSDSERHPGSLEICGDGLDNDCDGQDDGDCPDYGGDFVLDETVQYQCAGGLVNLTLHELALQWTPPVAEATNSSGPKPEVLTGEIEGDGSFVLDQELPGACTERYRLSGRFLSEDAFEATFEAQFLGSCFNCSNQSFPGLTGIRVGAD